MEQKLVVKKLQAVFEGFDTVYVHKEEPRHLKLVE